MGTELLRENHRVELKRELTPDLDLEKEVIAFLNSREGGFIYIGVDKTGQRLGVSDVDGDMLKLKDRIKNNINPSAMGLFDVLEIEGPPAAKPPPSSKSLPTASKSPRPAPCLRA